MEYLTVKQDQTLWNRETKNVGRQALLAFAEQRKAAPERKCDFVIL